MSPLFAPDTLSGPWHSRRLLPLVTYSAAAPAKASLWRGVVAALPFAVLPAATALVLGATMATAATLGNTAQGAVTHSAPAAQGNIIAAGSPVRPNAADHTVVRVGGVDDGIYGPVPAPPPLAVQGNTSAGYSGSMEPCLLGHGQRDLYRTGLQAMGWVDISDAGRPVAIAMLADAFLPITGAMDGRWEDHLAHRPTSHAFWTDMAQNRTLMEREGRILLLAGFLDPNGEMRVECWTAGPETTATDSFFLLAGQVWQSEGVTMTQLNIPATTVTAQTDILVSRITPPTPMEPPLFASDGLRTTTIFPMNASQL